MYILKLLMRWSSEDAHLRAAFWVRYDSVKRRTSNFDSRSSEQLLPLSNFCLALSYYYRAILSWIPQHCTTYSSQLIYFNIPQVWFWISYLFRVLMGTRFKMLSQLYVEGPHCRYATACQRCYVFCTVLLCASTSAV